MGAGQVAGRLPALVDAVRAAGHPVIWLCDPMHGNTVTTADGVKTRTVTAVVQEVRDFLGAVRAAGGCAGGLHLETTPDDVRECVADAAAVTASRVSRSLCDPRLNPAQARVAVSAWSRPEAGPRGRTRPGPAAVAHGIPAGLDQDRTAPVT